MKSSRGNACQDTRESNVIIQLEEAVLICPELTVVTETELRLKICCHKMKRVVMSVFEVRGIMQECLCFCLRVLDYIVSHFLMSWFDDKFCCWLITEH